MKEQADPDLPMLGMRETIQRHQRHNQRFALVQTPFESIAVLGPISPGELYSFRRWGVAASNLLRALSNLKPSPQMWPVHGWKLVENSTTCYRYRVPPEKNQRSWKITGAYWAPGLVDGVRL